MMAPRWPWKDTWASVGRGKKWARFCVCRFGVEGLDGLQASWCLEALAGRQGHTGMGTSGVSVTRIPDRFQQRQARPTVAAGRPRAHNPPMWLVVDTALPRAAVGLVTVAAPAGGDVDGPGPAPIVETELLLTETKRHAERLPDAVAEVLQAAHIDVDALEGIAVGTGPGSFIGIRTGLSFCKGLAASRTIPLVGLPSLLSLALSGSMAPGTVAAVDARRGERYLATLGLGEEMLGLAALSPADAGARLRVERPAMVVGILDGVDVPDDVDVEAFAGPTALGLGRALQRRLESAHRRGLDLLDERRDLVPIYLRDADAKKPATDPAWRRAAALATIAADGPSIPPRPPARDTP